MHVMDILLSDFIEWRWVKGGTLTLHADGLKIEVAAGADLPDVWDSMKDIFILLLQHEARANSQMFDLPKVIDEIREHQTPNDN